MVDTGTAAWTLPAATVTGVQTVSLQNINGVGAVKEVSTIVLNGMAANTTFTVGDLVLTNSTGAAVTGAQMATVLTGGTVTNLTLSGGAGTSTRPTNFEVGTLGNTSSTVVFTAQNAGALTDLTIGGTSQSGVNSVQILTFATNPGNANNTLSVNVNGVTATSAAAGNTNAAALQNEVSTLANAINLAAGSTIATYDGDLSIIINAPRSVTISALTASGTANTTTMTPSFAPVVQTLTLGATVPGATTAVTFRLNGVQYTTAALAADTPDALGAAYVAAINTAVGRTVASYVDATNVLTINNGTFGGLAFTNVGSGNTEKTFGVTTASTGYVAPNTATQTIVQGVTATTFNDTVDATKFTGATNFTSETSNGDVTFNGLTSAQSVTVNGGVGAVTANFGTTAGTTTATINVSGAHNTGNLTLSGGAGSGIATVTLNSLGSTTATTATTAALGANIFGATNLGGAATALTINAANNLNTGDITGFTGTTATITVAGAAGIVNLGTLQNTTVQTVNASGLTAGGVTVTLNTNATMAFTGGAGVDTVTTGAVLTTGTVNGGGGSGDILVVANNAHVNTSALAAKYTNFEILRVTGTMDASLISGITQVQLSGATNNISNLSASQSVTARSTTGSIGATTLAPVSGTTNTLNLTMGNTGTTAAANNSGALTISGYQTLNLTVTPGATTALGGNRTATIDSFTAANLTAINLTGTAVTLTNAATTLATTINGSALTGNGNTGTDIAGLTIGGNLVTGSSVIGSAVRDQFTLGTAANVTYDGGLGNDLFITTVTNLGTGGANDPTLIGGSGTDTLRISSAAPTLTDDNFKKVSGFEALNLADATDNISITGLTTNANSAFATGLTVTAGSTATPMATAKTFTFESLAYANNVTLTLITNNAMTTNAGNISITTGAGNDTVTVTAASLTGAAGGGGNGSVLISTGSGVDTITVTTGTLAANTAQAVRITAGTGADVIDVTSHVNAGSGAGNIMFTMAAGDSTTTAYDVITGFRTALANATISDNLDFASVAISTYTATAAAGYTAAQLTVAVANTGLVTLAGTSAATLSLADAIAAIQSVVTVGAGDTAVLNYATAGVNSAYVFNNNSTADSVVQLVGVTAVSLTTTATVTTPGHILIS